MVVTTKLAEDLFFPNTTVYSATQRYLTAMAEAYHQEFPKIDVIHQYYERPHTGVNGKIGRSFSHNDSEIVFEEKPKNFYCLGSDVFWMQNFWWIKRGVLKDRI